MAFTLLNTLIFLSLLILSLARASFADVTVIDATNKLSLHLDSDETMMSIYDDIEAFDDERLSVSGGRSLLWWRMRYYISYGALSANRVPCPPRSGRSYYTQNCWKATGPVHPYSRGCSTITRCRR
ncbi:hypothetical protein QVD17_04815 [Tagetes erecta]|uniref:Rapid ALkalinization Factor n=1 Tax=Tagetes erecta TaxID=13708 RepID=A0AAD8LK95_TARER|nr:hypothetical protein QVD17_04815 [Tagetes erecta]